MSIRNVSGMSGAAAFCLLILTAAPVFAQSTAPVVLPASVSRANTPAYDGVWSGAGTLNAGSTGDCTQQTRIKFQVKEGRIFMDGFTHGAFYGRSGASTLVGVIHADRSVEITITSTRNGRTSIAFGQLGTDGEMVLKDPGATPASCGFTYRLQKT